MRTPYKALLAVWLTLAVACSDQPPEAAEANAPTNALGANSAASENQEYEQSLENMNALQLSQECASALSDWTTTPNTKERLKILLDRLRKPTISQKSIDAAISGTAAAGGEKSTGSASAISECAKNIEIKISSMH